MLLKIKPLYLIIMLFLFINVGIILYNRSIWFDTAFSLEIANRPLSYFTFSDPLLFVLCFFFVLVCILIFIRRMAIKRHRWVGFLALALTIPLYYKIFVMAVPKDVHPPLSYVFLKGWTAMFGWTPYSARAMTLLFGLVGIVFLYKIIENIYDEKTAVYLTGILAFCSSYMQYFTEIRMYSMYFAFSVMSFYFLVRYFETGFKFWQTYYILSLIPYPFIHWYMCYPFLMQVIYIFLFNRRYFIGAWDKFLIVVAAWIPAILYFLKQVTRLEGMWLKQATLKSFFSTVHYFFFHSNTDLRGNIENWIGYGLVLFSFIAIYLYVSGLDEIKERRYAFFFMLYALLPPIIGLVIQRFWNVYHHRYFVFMGWAFILLLVRSTMLKKYKAKWHNYYIVVFELVLIITIGYQAGYYLRTTAFELRDMSDYVRDNYCNSDYALLHESPFSSVPAQYYMRLYGCNNTNWIHSDLDERLFRSAGGDVIPMETRLNTTEAIVQNIDKGLYWCHKNNLLGPEYHTEVLLEFDGINLTKFERIKQNGKFDVSVEVVANGG